MGSERQAEKHVNAPAAPPTMPPRSPPRRTGWCLHLLLITACPLVVGVLGWSHGALQGPALRDTAPGLLMVCVLELLVFGVVFGLAWLASRASAEELLLPWRGGAWVVPLSFAYSIALRLAVAIVALFVIALLLLTRIVTFESIQHHRPDLGAVVDLPALLHNPLYFWLSLSLVSFVLGGFREELWRSAFLAGMRRLWPRQFGSQAGQLAAAALAAILFGLAHLAQGPIAAAMACLLGLGLGAIMVLHRSIWPAVLAHGLFDATSFLALTLLHSLVSPGAGPQ